MGFAPEADTAEAHLAFNRTGDRLIRLRDQGLLDFTDGTVKKYLGTKGKYSLIHVRGITEAGRRELARYELPGAAIAQAVREKIKQEFLARAAAFVKRKSELVDDATRRGMTRSSRLFVVLREAVGQEYNARADVVFRYWQQVIQARGMAHTPDLSALLRKEAESALTEDSRDLEAALDQAERISGYSSPAEDVQDLRQRALDAFNANVEFAMIAPGTPPPEPGQAGDQFTIHGNVGAVQTGAGSSATVTMHVGPFERQSILNEFRELRRLVHEAALPPDQLQPIEETLALAIVEAEKPEPNAIILKALAMGTAVTIQTMGALPAALEVARRLAALLGFHF